jgi:hypothetical protein
MIAVTATVRASYVAQHFLLIFTGFLSIRDRTWRVELYDVHTVQCWANLGVASFREFF